VAVCQFIPSVCVCVWVPTWSRLCHGMCWRSCGNLDPHNLLQHDPISCYSFTSCLVFLVAFPQKFCHQLYTLCLAPPMLYVWPNTTSFIWVLMNQDITHLKKSQDTLKEEDIRMCRIGHIILLQQAPQVKNTRLCTLYDALPKQWRRSVYERLTLQFRFLPTGFKHFPQLLLYHIL
jgi:hypothetical protein